MWDWIGDSTCVRIRRCCGPPRSISSIGNPAKARERLGWQPTVGFRELIELMVDADLAAVRAELAARRPLSCLLAAGSRTGVRRRRCTTVSPDYAMRFLITGITGFAARHLAQRLLADGHDVFGTTRRRRGVSAGVLAPERITEVDLREAAAVTEVLRRVRPDGLFHLAAITDVAASLADPDETYRVNLFGSLHVFAAVRAVVPACRVVWVGSSQAYGDVDAAELPLTERQLFRPLSPYAASKAAADLAAYQWARAAGLDIVRLRPFNHTGPGQTPLFVCADFARQITEIERGVRPPSIEAGNLEVVRDFTDVRDVVRAYALAWERGGAGEAYNVCSGIGRTPREIIDGLLRLSGVQATVTVSPERQRPIDVPALVGSAAKLQQATGWSPAISWEQTLRDLLEDFRRRAVCG